MVFAAANLIIRTAIFYVEQRKEDDEPFTSSTPNRRRQVFRHPQCTSPAPWRPQEWITIAQM